MKVLVLGATGGTGQRIVQEALAQGYKVTALVRSLTKGEAIFPNIKILFPEMNLIQGDAIGSGGSCRRPVRL
ncbi:NAD(P)H-binding protein [Novacetimonas hansenii]|uniref:NAD(P)H-binding protein n=1 Tax=Novacetimonas hansenii TaxID=436 RepID=UPI00079630CE|nr:NAD(P)H-binding protein [Novacetimonas hansenii]CUW46319.1 NmrA-like family protein [Novacetimonas hansenii]